MGVLKTRRRLVSFRLTEEELENLRLACLMQGARNVSDFARGAVLELAQARGRPGAQLLDRFSALELRMADIEAVARTNGDMLRAVLKNLATPPREKARGA
jgi:hypothetical protein